MAQSRIGPGPGTAEQVLKIQQELDDEYDRLESRLGLLYLKRSKLAIQQLEVNEALTEVEMAIDELVGRALKHGVDFR